MLIGKPPDIPSSEITSRTTISAISRAAAFSKALPQASERGLAAFARTPRRARHQAADRAEPADHDRRATHQLSTTSPTTTTSTSSASTRATPRRTPAALPTRPWTVKVEGKVAKPQTFDIDELLKLRPLEDRVYRHRCVEAWSMVIPWVGYSLSEFIKQCNPLSTAKYVQFLSYYDGTLRSGARRARH